MRPALFGAVVVGLMAVAGVALAESASEEDGENTAISWIEPSSGETTPGGRVSATVAVDSGILSTCLTATSDDPINITVTFDSLALSCGVGTWYSDMKVSVSTLTEPGLYTVHVRLVDALGSLLESHKWPLTVTSPATTTSTTSTTTTTTLPKLTTTTFPKLTTTTLPSLITTSSTATTTVPTTTSSSTSTTTTTVIAAGADGGPADPGGGDGAGGDGSGEGSGSSERSSGLRQTSVGVGGNFDTDLFGSTQPEVLGFEIAAGFSNAVELVEASWIWVLALALLIAGVLIKGIDRRVSAPVSAGRKTAG